jgi:hypothetical protein
LPDCLLKPGTPVIVYLHSPKEKVWGLVLAIDPAGVVVRGLDLAIFDAWMRQEARGEETLLGPTTLFYPLWRLERIEVDETVGPVPAYADRFRAQTGRSVQAASYGSSSSTSWERAPTGARTTGTKRKRSACDQERRPARGFSGVIGRLHRG